MQFTFFESYYEALKDLDAETQSGVLMAICEYYFEDREPEVTGVVRSIFSLIRPLLEKSKARSLAGRTTKSETNEIKSETNEIKSETNEISEKKEKNQKKEKDKDIEKDKDKESRARAYEIGFRTPARPQPQNGSRIMTAAFGGKVEPRARTGTEILTRTDDLADVFMDL